MPTLADPIRLATWHGDFSRKGPGLLLRDVLGGRDPGIAEATRILVNLNADVLVLTHFDFDHDLVALRAFADRLAAAGADYPHIYAPRPNSGMGTGLDLDGDGRTGGPRDAQGYGRFAGDGSIAMLSRLPVADVQEFSDLLWQDAPDSAMNADDTGRDVQRLSSTAHAMITLQSDTGPLSVGIFVATPPVFDGPEDRNGRRNRDEVLFWHHLLSARIDAAAAPESRFVLMGNANLDPDKGDGLRAAMAQVLRHPVLQDPLPGVPTVAWEGPGEMRVSYVLPSQDLPVVDADVLQAGQNTGPHRLVWVDLDIAR